MGNTLATESQSTASSHEGDRRPTTGQHRTVSLKGSTSFAAAASAVDATGRPLLQRKGSSFLDEPVTHKLTERGEAIVTLGSGNEADNADNGREGCEPREVVAGKMRYAVSEMQGWRSHMEDKHVLNTKLSKNQQQVELLKDHHLFAVFDGHGGDFASHFCGEHLVETLTSQKGWKEYLSLETQNKRESVQGLHLLKTALTSSFLELDDRLMAAQRKRRLDQLSQLETLVYSLGGTVEHDVFQSGTGDHRRILNFDRSLPSSMPANVPLERSGSTGVVVLVTPAHIVCANAGDSRAILSKKGEVLPLSFDHKPTNDVEVTRVERDGGFVRAGRVDGDLAVSRSFGDFGYKNCRDDNPDWDADFSPGCCATSPTGGSSVISKSSSLANTGSKPKDYRVTVQPDILVHTREPSKDDFIVLACDGIWDRLTNRDCSDLVRTLIDDEGETDVGLICEEVIDTALELDSRDNMTCLLAVFPGANLGVTDAPSAGGVANRAVMKRRLERERSWGRDSTPAKRAHRRLEERRRRHREVLAATQKRSHSPAKARSQSPAKARSQSPAPAKAPALRRVSSKNRSVHGLKIEEPNGGTKVSSSSSSQRKHKAAQSPARTPGSIGGRLRKSSRTQPENVAAARQ